MSRKNTVPSHATRIRAENPRQALAIGLMHVAWRVFDETYGRGRETAMMVTDQVGMTLEEGAAASFVRNGDMALRELLPEAFPSDIETWLSLRLREAYGSPHRKRYEREVAQAGLTLEQHLAGDLTVTLLIAFGAFGPGMPGHRSPERTGVRCRPR